MQQQRFSLKWKRLAAGLSLQSVAYTLTVIGTLFRWLVKQHYAPSNPFAGINLCGGERSIPMDEACAFPEGAKALVRAAANELEWVVRLTADGGPLTARSRAM